MCPYEFFRDICHYRYQDKKYATIFFLGKLAFFIKKICFQQPLLCYRIDLMTSTVFVRTYFRPLQNVPLCLSCSIIREEIGHILESQERWLVFEKFGTRLLRSSKNHHIAGTKLVNWPCVPLWVVPWHLSCSISRQKIRHNFFAGKTCFFSKNFCFQQPLRC